MQGNEYPEAFAFWKDVTVDAWTTSERKGGPPKKAEVSLCLGIAVDERGTCVRIEGATSADFTFVYLDAAKERALYEALRARFDAKHRSAVEDAALAKLSPLEQDVLRARWGKRA